MEPWWAGAWKMAKHPQGHRASPKPRTLWPQVDVVLQKSIILNLHLTFGERKNRPVVWATVVWSTRVSPFCMGPCGVTRPVLGSSQRGASFPSQKWFFLRYDLLDWDPQRDVLVSERYGGSKSHHDRIIPRLSSLCKNLNL